MISLSRKQNEYIRDAHSRINLKIGAVRSGKTYLDNIYTIPARLKEVRSLSGLNLILGVSRETIERNVLQPMREQYTERLVGVISNRNIARICGEDVYCLGAEKITQVAKIQGMSVKYCYGDEIAKWNKEVFAMLLSRLDKPYSCFDGACNPESPTHWLKEFIDRKDIDMFVQKYTIFDNPFLPDKFVRNLCKEYEGTVYYGRYILGEWTRAEGLIYPMYENVIKEELPDSFEAYCMSLDYGTQNAFGAIIWALSEGTWYGIQEYYYSGRETGKQKADDEYLKDLDVFTNWLFVEGENKKSIMAGRKLETIIDPSAASFKVMLRKSGRYKVRDADNSVADGIRETATCMNLGLIKIHTSLVNWKKEAAGYVWDNSKEQEMPVKHNDHLMDTTRYFVKTKRVIKTRKKQHGNLSGLEFL